MVHWILGSPIGFSVEHVLDQEGIPLPVCGDVLKKKMSDARYKMLDIITKFDKSDQGDGSILEPEDGAEPYIADATQKSAFQGAYNSHILYLWQLCDDYDLLNSVKSVLPEEYSVNGSTIASSSLTASARKRLKIADDTCQEAAAFRHAFDDNMSDFVDTQRNIAITQRSLAESQKSIAASKDCENMLQAIDALSRAEIDLQNASLSNNAVAVVIYKKKTEMIKKQIAKMNGEME